MKISREWLQKYFQAPLPNAEKIGEALTFHAFEIESVENDVLDVKVTPNRGHDALSHRGIAKELSAILNVPLKHDPLRVPTPVNTGEAIHFDIKDKERASVAAAAYLRGVKIGPSPDWLKQSLEAIGQRSINNVVDATNYVMFDIGMPTHAFDATTFKKDGAIHYGIRTSEKGEKLVLLKGQSVELSGQEAVIMNAKGEAVDIGGVRGGALAELNDGTTELVLSASKFHPVHTRKAAQRFNQRTEAAKRFENEMADDLACYGIQAVAELVRDVAGGEIVGIGIEKSRATEARTVSVTRTKIVALLGTDVSEQEVESTFKRLDLPLKKSGDMYSIDIPFERLDLTIPEDLIEEVGRMIGYERIPAKELPPFEKQPEINQNFAAQERVRKDLTELGYSEVFTSIFADKGEIAVLNKVDGARPFLRSSLTDGLDDALKKNVQNKDLLGLREVKLFEIGTIWKGGKEEVVVGIVSESEKAKEDPLGMFVKKVDLYESFPLSETARYQPFSRFPSITRDIALWVSADTKAEDVQKTIAKSASNLCVRIDQFDEFKKGDTTSYAFRLVFQSFEKTLTDDEANSAMNNVYEAVKAKGWEVR